jgi:hypothetical protein
MWGPAPSQKRREYFRRVPIQASQSIKNPTAGPTPQASCNSVHCRPWRHYKPCRRVQVCTASGGFVVDHIAGCQRQTSVRRSQTSRYDRQGVFAAWDRAWVCYYGPGSSLLHAEAVRWILSTFIYQFCGGTQAGNRAKTVGQHHGYKKDSSWRDRSEYI